MSAANPWRIGPRLLAHIEATIPAGLTILELGSGEGTGLLAARYTMYSVEHDPAWLNRYDGHYIYAPLIGDWYCTHLLDGRLPGAYDALLIDGPPGTRFPMARYLDLFDLSVPVFIDDVNRRETYLLAEVIATKTGRSLAVFDEGDQRVARQYGYVAAA